MSSAKKWDIHFKSCSFSLPNQCLQEEEKVERSPSTSVDYALDSHPLRRQEGCIHQVRFGFKQQMFLSITMFNVVNTGGPGGISCSPRESLGHFKEPHWPPPGLRSQRGVFWLSRFMRMVIFLGSILCHFYLRPRTMSKS